MVTMILVRLPLVLSSLSAFSLSLQTIQTAISVIFQFSMTLLISILIWVGLSVTFGAGVEVLEHDADDARGQFEAQQGTSRAGSLGGSAGN